MSIFEQILAEAAERTEIQVKARQEYLKRRSEELKEITKQFVHPDRRFSKYRHLPPDPTIDFSKYKQFTLDKLAAGGTLQQIANYIQDDSGIPCSWQAVAASLSSGNRNQRGQA